MLRRAWTQFWGAGAGVGTGVGLGCGVGEGEGDAERPGVRVATGVTVAGAARATAGRLRLNALKAAEVARRRRNVRLVCIAGQMSLTGTRFATRIPGRQRGQTNIRGIIEEDSSFSSIEAQRVWSAVRANRRG